MSPTRARSALPLLARFARRFEATEWLASATTTTTTTMPRPSSLPEQKEEDGRRSDIAPPAPTATAPPFSPSLPPLLAHRRPYSFSSSAAAAAAASSTSPPSERGDREEEEEAQPGHRQGPQRPSAEQSPPELPPPRSQSPPSPPPPPPDPAGLLRLLPPALQPYAELMRLDKPVGSWLLAWPGLWSIALAAAPGSLPDPALCLLFGLGSVLLRGAGCTVNDLLDRRIDARVARTQNRPLASGRVSPLQASCFLVLQLSLGLEILSQLNAAAQALGLLSLGLVLTYPLMKRVTWWPQAFLGLTINWGALMGCAAASAEASAAGPPAVRLTAEALRHVGSDPAAWASEAAHNAAAAFGAMGTAAAAWGPAACLYGSGVAWTLVYDTIYAHQDIRDDARVGVKSTARLFASKGVSKPALAAFGGAQAAMLAGAGLLAGAGPLYFAGAAAASSHVAWQVAAVDLSDGSDCAAKFACNKWTGALVWAGIVLDRLLMAVA